MKVSALYAGFSFQQSNWWQTGKKLTTNKIFTPGHRQIAIKIVHSMKNSYKLWAMFLAVSVILCVGILVIFNLDFQKPVCNKPYILVGTSCCLDQNDNSICDKDEITTQQNRGSNTPETPSDTSVAFVSKVVDGDTIELQNNGEVRLLGINTPERGQPYYQEATDRLKELVEGKTVVLESDIQDKDQYGRLLRYVFIDDMFVNVQLVKEGYATVYVIPPNEKYEKEFKDAWSYCLSKNMNLCKQPTGENVCDNRCIGIPYFNWNAEGSDCDNLNDEYVTLINTCSYSCNLTDWTVKDESSRDPYVFPDFVLENGTTTTLYTGCGTDTQRELYWCSSGLSCNAVWNNDGDTLYLRNSNGELVLNYSYTGFQ